MAAVTAMPLTVSLIKTQAALHFGVGLDEIMGYHQAAYICRARHAAMYLAREMTGHSYPKLGRLFHRDHTTVMHAVAAAQRRMEHNPEYAADVEALRRSVAPTIEANREIATGRVDRDAEARSRVAKLISNLIVAAERDPLGTLKKLEQL